MDLVMEAINWVAGILVVIVIIGGIEFVLNKYFRIPTFHLRPKRIGTKEDRNHSNDS